MKINTLSAATFLLALPSANAAFHLMTRFQRVGNFLCEGLNCKCDYEIGWRMGAVPSNQYNCDAFNNDHWFPKTIGEGGNWNTNLATICGSKEVNMYVVNGGNNLEVYEANANPGKLLAKCYRQGDNTIDCPPVADPPCRTNSKSTVYDVWVCSDTSLCN